MRGRIRRVDEHNVYEERLERADGGSYMGAASVAADFAPVFPEDPEWQEVLERHLNEVAELSAEGLEIIGLAVDGECVALCGYRMLSDDGMIMRGREVELPYEMFMVLDDCIDIGEDLVHAAQLFIASREGLRVVQLVG